MNIDDFGMDTITLAGPLEAKLRAIRGAGFTQVMLNAGDIVGHPDGEDAAVRAVRESGLRVTGFQVLRDFEGLSGHLHAYKVDVAKAMLAMCRALGSTVLLACSSTSAHATGEPESLVRDLRKLALLAVPFGIRIAYEALSWGRHVNLPVQAWEIVRTADRANLGVCIDSYHVLAHRAPNQHLPAAGRRGSADAARALHPRQRRRVTTSPTARAPTRWPSAVAPDRIGVWGTSRGGHLGALLATTGDVKELEGDVGGNLEHSSRIQCAVLYYSLTSVLGNGTDLAARYPDRARAQDARGGLAAQLLGLKDARGLPAAREAVAKGDRSDPSLKAAELARLSDPVNYVTNTAAPILLAHSSIDSVVAVEQSERLYRKYLENGLDANLYLWSRGAHGAVGLDIEAASSEWLARKLPVELAPKR